MLGLAVVVMIPSIAPRRWRKPVQRHQRPVCFEWTVADCKQFAEETYKTQVRNVCTTNGTVRNEGGSAEGAWLSLGCQGQAHRYYKAPLADCERAVLCKPCEQKCNTTRTGCEPKTCKRCEICDPKKGCGPDEYNSYPCANGCCRAGYICCPSGPYCCSPGYKCNPTGGCKKN